MTTITSIKLMQPLSRPVWPGRSVCRRCGCVDLLCVVPPLSHLFRKLISEAKLKKLIKPSTKAFRSSAFVCTKLVQFINNENKKKQRCKYFVKETKQNNPPSLVTSNTSQAHSQQVKQHHRHVRHCTSVTNKMSAQCFSTSHAGHAPEFAFTRLLSSAYNCPSHFWSCDV